MTQVAPAQQTPPAYVTTPAATAPGANSSAVNISITDPKVVTTANPSFTGSKFDRIA